LVYDLATNTFNHLDVRTKPEHSNTAYAIYKDSFGELWIYTAEPGITRMNSVTLETKYYAHPKGGDYFRYSGTSRFVREDEYGNLWILPNNGYLSYYNRESDNLEYIYTNPYDKSTIFLPEITGLMADNRGFLWYKNSSSKGIINLCILPNNYKFLDLNRNNDTRALLFDHEDNLWVGTKWGNISVYDKNNKLLGYLQADGTLDPDAGDFNINPYCIFEDSNNNIWIDTKLNGLYLLKRSPGTNNVISFSHYTENELDENSLHTRSIYSIFEDSHKRIWFSSFGSGIIYCDPNKNGELKFIHRFNKLSSYPDKICQKVRFITEVQNGVMLAATTDGLITFSSNFTEPGDIIFYHNKHDQLSPSGLNSDDIMHILPGSNGRIYLSSASGGINEIISQNLLSDSIRFRAYTTKEGLASNVCLSTIEDTEHNFWAVSENTLSRLNSRDGTIEILNRPNYLSDFLFSEAIPVSRKDEIYFGSEIGIIKINPFEITKNRYIPPVEFTSIMVQSNEQQKYFTGSNEIRLYPDERNITFQYAAIDYASASNIRYAYRMEGLESDWNFAEKNRSASYLNLPDGHFNFQVKSTNSYGNWEENIKSFSIYVKPKIWETPWAWLIYSLLFLVLLIVAVYIVLYIYKLRNQVHFEQQLSQVKLQFFTDISHELRTPLTLIANPVNELLEKENLTEKGTNYLNIIQSNTDRLVRLVNQVLDFRKIQANKMSLIIERFDLVPFITKISEDFKLLAQEKSITFRIEHEVSALFVFCDKDKVEKIVINLLSNAFKFTPDGKSITIKTTGNETSFFISVIDEGVGIPADRVNEIFKRFETAINYNFSRSSTGIGLSFTKELVELMDGKIEVSSIVGKGTNFMISLPVSRVEYQKTPLAEFIIDDIDSQTEHRQITAENHPDNNKPTILVVDDNIELLQFINDILNEKYNTLLATNGKDGLNMTRQFFPDIILSDLMMPEMDGLEMIQNIKNDPEISPIPIIMMSAKSSVEDRIKGIESGIDDYLPKPFNSKYLKSRIQGLIDQRALMKNYYLNLPSKGNRGVRQDLDLSQPLIKNTDDEFIRKVMDYIEKNIEQSDIKIDDVAYDLGLSRTGFYRKMKTLIGISPIELIMEMRIKRAMQYIENSDYRFTEIAYKTGFNEPQYFSKCFRKQVGKSPSEYKKSLKSMKR